MLESVGMIIEIQYISGKKKKHVPNHRNQFEQCKNHETVLDQEIWRRTMGKYDEIGQIIDLNGGRTWNMG